MEAINCKSRHEVMMGLIALNKISSEEASDIILERILPEYLKSRPGIFKAFMEGIRIDPLNDTSAYFEILYYLEPYLLN